GTEVAVDGLSQCTGRLAATVGGEVLPEDGVVGVATQVESKVLGQSANLVGVGALLACLLESVECSVGACNVGCVVLGVVQLHDLSRDVWLESVVCVIKLRKFVNSHVVSFRWVRHRAYTDFGDSSASALHMGGASVDNDRRFC